MANSVMIICRHCGKTRRMEARGLCWQCWSKPRIRNQYEPLAPGEVQKIAISQPSETMPLSKGILEQILMAFGNVIEWRAIGDRDETLRQMMFLRGMKAAYGDSEAGDLIATAIEVAESWGRENTGGEADGN